MKSIALGLAVAATLAISSHAEAQTDKFSGDVNTIVMNAVTGGSAVGMNLELYEVSGTEPRKVGQASTGENGRADLIAKGPLQAGKYELRFQVGDYFRKQGIATGDPALLDFVPVRFSITDPMGHYHVPLICTPWGYTTYRGS